MGINSKKGNMSKAIIDCKTSKNAIIAEIKTYSPKYGDLLKERNIINILRTYERAGASGISYITERGYFNGDFDIYELICRESELPVLRKDFILTKEEIEKTAEADGSAILLIARLLEEKTAEFVDFSIEHGLDTLVEVHNPAEVDIAKETGTSMIGINNRDIRKLEIDDGTVSLTKELSKLIPKDTILVSESGISTIEDLQIALKNADAALIGTAFMKAENQEEFVRNFVEAKIC